jgi:hypothetical protein
VVTVGEQDATDTSLGQFMKIWFARLNRIDAEIPQPIGNQKAVEVVAGANPPTATSIQKTRTLRHRPETDAGIFIGAIGSGEG